jgi:hypothetical protein
MKTSNVKSLAAGVSCCLLAVILPWNALPGADEGTTDAPGFRPRVDDGSDAAFVAALPEASIAVLPCVVRSIEGLKHDAALAGSIATALRDANVATRIDVAKETVNLPEHSGGQPQFATFQAELGALAGAVKPAGVSADYVVLVEFLVAPRRGGGESVAGIHCFVFTREGRNAFSFLLNSHHRILVDAQLRAEGTDESARGELLAKAAQVAAEALGRQIASARGA